MSAVVMDPYTGEIYAEATLPVVRRQRLPRGRGVGSGALHRPGRVERLRAGLGVQDDDRGDGPEAGTVTRTTKIKDVGTLRLDGGRTKIDNADRKGMGWITFEDGIAYSRNVVAAKVALGLGDSVAASSAMLYDTWRKLGLRRQDRHRRRRRGRRHRCATRPSQPWSEIDLANAAFGQGVAVTPIQLATAFADAHQRRDDRRSHTSSRPSGRTTSTRSPGSRVVDPAVAKKSAA